MTNALETIIYFFAGMGIFFFVEHIVRIIKAMRK